MIQCKEIQQLEAKQLKQNIPSFRIGDTLDIHLRIIEGEKERTQVFTGTVIARRGGGLAETIALYRVSYGAGIERVFPIHSPRISKIEVVRGGKVRKAKLYHLRGLSGKKAKVEGRLETAGAGAAAPEAETAE
jgi:large subunit ribosomal protein L19